MASPLQNRCCSPFQRALVSRGARLQTCRVGVRGDIVRAGSQPVQHSAQPPPPPRKPPHACKIAPTPAPGNLSFISLSPFLSTPSPASPPEGAAPPGKMRIETAREFQQREQEPPLSTSQAPARGQGSNRAQAQARGQAAGQLRTQKRRSGNTEHEKAIRQQKMRTNRNTVGLRAFQMRIEPFSRNTVHLAAFSREAAQDRSPGWSEAKAWVRTRAAPTPQCCHMAHRSGARGAGNNLSIPTVDRSVLCRKKYSDLGKPTKGSAPAKKHPQPPRNSKVRGTFQPENSRKKGNTYYK